MLAHFMLFSEADIEYRFLMATSILIEEEAINPVADSKVSSLKSTTSRFHKVSLGLVSGKNRKNKNGKF
jgi:hypothetical protein